MKKRTAEIPRFSLPAAILCLSLAAMAQAQEAASQQLSEVGPQQPSEAVRLRRKDAALSRGIAREPTLPGPSRVPQAVAVYASDLSPYREALKGFEEVFGGNLSSYNLSKDKIAISSGTRIIVTFGGKAAKRDYPEDAALIYALAPGTRLDPKGRRGPSILISMLPPAKDLVSELSQIQPGAKKLAALWVSDSFDDYGAQMKEACGLLGLSLVGRKLEGPDELPDALRELDGEPDALWIAPDPLLVNARTFAVLKSFSWSNHIPFYVSAEGLVEKGATASISGSFREMGRTAGRTALEVLAGKEVPGVVHPQKTEITFNRTSALNSGLKIPPKILKRITREEP